MYERFAADVDVAQAQVVRRNVLQVEMAATTGDWRAAAWWLERRYPETFGRQTRVTIQQSVEDLENELRELVVTERANVLIEEARHRVARLRQEYEAERIEGVPELRAVGGAEDAS